MPTHSKKTTPRHPTALTIAGSDSGGGAGIQADLKTFTLCQVFGTSVITAITAQNTQGVFAISQLPSDIITAQLHAIKDDFCVGAVKIGMLGDVATINAVKAFLGEYQGVFGKVILDPVMIAKGGAKLLNDNAITALKSLLPFADIITPNLPETAALTGMMVKGDGDIASAITALQNLGVKNAIIKGGHRTDDICRDWVWLDGELYHLDTPRIHENNTHGTGCTFSACLAANLAKGIDTKTAIKNAKDFISQAIKNPIRVGQGINPVNHWAGATNHQGA